jgi:hypothetical protein
MAFLSNSANSNLDLSRLQQRSSTLASVGRFLHRSPTPILSMKRSASVNLNTVKLTNRMTETQAAQSGAARVKVGTQTLYIGTRQATSINQDPIVLAYEGGKLKWANTKYETTGADGRGYGLFYNGTSLYGVFSIDGTQGLPAQDFRRVSGGATQAWMRSYGTGGGAKAAVVAKLDLKNGNLQSAVYLSAINSGKTNSFQVKGLGMNGKNLWVNAISYFAPRKIDGTAMRQIDITAKSPFSYSIELTADLKTAVKASATGWQA